MRKELRKKIVNVAVYIANDGNLFDNEIECLKYEESIAKEKLVVNTKNLLVEKLCHMPCDGIERYERNIFDWYKINNKQELALINELYNSDLEIHSFPEYVCIEHSDTDVLDGFVSTLQECEDYVKQFFKAFDKKVIVKDIEK